MEKEFGYPGTARVMVDDVSLYEAKAYKEKIEAVGGVDRVLWADSETDVYQAGSFVESEDIEDYYKNEHSVMDIVFKEGDTSNQTSKAIDEIRKITGTKGHLIGPAVQDKSVSENLKSEMGKILTLAFVLIGLVLVLSTTSWFEPILFLFIMGIVIVINNGTNVFLGTISFLTSNVSSVLLLACSMDFSIFLLHAFIRKKEAGEEPEQAIRNALDEAMGSIIPSGVSTIAGFLMLATMKFTIGFDLGIVLAKGIVISMATVLFLMPALMQINSVVQQEAWEALSAGDAKRHNEILLEEIRRLDGMGYDAIVMAQVSMRALLPDLKDVKTPLLCSFYSGLDMAVERIKGL